ncbi:MAG TPA: (deoxy)nucleoside triphosphate pyrophosphohydrolase [Mycobacteriales bacterium]|nr:(deoxy)nucleoside triphosphate pyrophosphohydrolase [Mycobacteriales bacterium]
MLRTVRVVVGAALLDGTGRVLAARRRRPAGWELPGGKVEPGESEPAALARECREELGVTVEIGERVGPDVPVGGGWTLRAWTGRIVAGTPVAYEHAELRWVPRAELPALDWLPGDRPVIAALTGGGPG